MRVIAAFDQFSDVVHLLSYKTHFFEVVNRNEARGIVCVLLSDQEEPFVWRQFHACDLLDFLWHHNEAHFAHVGLGGAALVNVTDCDVVAYRSNGQLL